jgi:hypothetical protein
MNFTRPIAVSVCLLTLSLLFFFTPAVSACSFDDNGVVFLQERDPVPRNAMFITELRLSANQYSDSCAWFELLLKGSRIASMKGGNVVKIKERAEHGTQICDALELAVYKVDSPCNADHAFRWTPDRKLRWDDFQGAFRSGAGSRVAAETSCGISVETSLAPASARARIYVFNTFDKRQSWVRSGSRSEAILRHEQGHWDLCELYTRRMQARFDAVNIRGARLNELVNHIYDQVEREYLQRQQAYEMETLHGIDPDAQSRWESSIARELARS